jgi:hypothetical protein
MAIIGMRSWRSITRAANNQDEEHQQLLDSLEPQDYEDRFQKAKRELFSRSPWLASREDGVVTQALIKKIIIDELTLEKTATSANSAVLFNDASLEGKSSAGNTERTEITIGMGISE